ncbi:LuxR C-terminal-related transcriptional regulator [Streptomyces sp. NPDC046915]|uniref:LuxR C-terminal-related transcriptional regulator n=1 Tax=Streptomyces sp. NPDC046915 TaxID=3155257 RepID=UPI0033DF81CF
MLETLGLDTVCEAVYRVMLASPRSRLKDVAAAVGLPEQEVRHALDELAQLSLLRPSWEEQGHMRPISPEVGLEALLARQQAQLAVHQQQVEAARAAAASLIAEYAQLRPGHAEREVEYLDGIDSIRDRLAELTRHIQQEVCAFVPGRFLSEDNIAAARPLDDQLLNRGISLRTLYLDSIRHHTLTLAYARWLAERGADVRTVPTLPVRMTLIDRRIAVIPVSADSSGAAAVVLHGSGAVAAMLALFELTWQGATTIDSVKTRNAQGLTPQEQEVLRLLAAGHTDDVVAKRLDISVRTARRFAADLMERLDAKSRFQAGYRLAHAGWVETVQPAMTP